VINQTQPISGALTNRERLFQFFIKKQANPKDVSRENMGRQSQRVAATESLPGWRPVPLLFQPPMLLSGVAKNFNANLLLQPSSGTKNAPWFWT
jgi:hypothetical protein